MTLKVSHLSDQRQVATAVNSALRVTDQLNVKTLVNAANDAAAATAGVPVGAFYRNGSAIMIRTA